MFISYGTPELQRKHKVCFSNHTMLAMSYLVQAPGLAGQTNESGACKTTTLDPKNAWSQTMYIME